MSSYQNSRSTSEGVLLRPVFDDLGSRFFLNLPDEELMSFQRMFFQLQQAQWFYLDNCVSRNPALPKLNLKAFCAKFFQYCSLLQTSFNRFEKVYAQFIKYISQVPSCGCILLDPSMTKCLMVKSMKNNIWSFPSGKMDACEEEFECAIREVLEEVGFDVSKVINKDNFIEVSSRGKLTRSYIIPGVSETERFATRTVGEISEIQWIPIASIPSSYSPNNNTVKSVVPADLGDRLRSWIQRAQSNSRSPPRSSPSRSNNRQPYQQQVVQPQPQPVRPSPPHQHNMQFNNFKTVRSINQAHAKFAFNSSRDASFDSEFRLDMDTIMNSLSSSLLVNTVA